MSIERHIKDARSITDLFEKITKVILALFALAELINLFTLNIIGLLLVPVLAFVWWIAMRLSYIGLELLTDLVDLQYQQTKPKQVKAVFPGQAMGKQS